METYTIEFTQNNCVETLLATWEMRMYFQRDINKTKKDNETFSKNNKTFNKNHVTFDESTESIQAFWHFVQSPVIITCKDHPSNEIQQSEIYSSNDECWIPKSLNQKKSFNQKKSQCNGKKNDSTKPYFNGNSVFGSSHILHNPLKSQFKKKSKKTKKFPVSKNVRNADACIEHKRKHQKCPMNCSGRSKTQVEETIGSPQAVTDVTFQYE